MALTQAQLDCLKTARSDIVRAWVGGGWSANDPEAIFRNWWAPPTNHGMTLPTPDPSSRYGTLEAYADALCGGGGGGGGGTTPGGRLPPPDDDDPSGPGGSSREAYRGIDKLLQMIKDQWKRDPLPLLAAGAAAGYVILKRRG